MTPAEHPVKVPDVVDDDETSSSGSSSDSDDDIEETSPTGDRAERSSSARQIPEFSTRPTTGQTSDLKSRLQAFLPQLEKANSELAKADDMKERRLDDVADDEEHYIEMNLELGVLSERKSGGEDGKLKFHESDSEDEGEDEDDGAPTVQPLPENEAVISRLKGEKVQQKQRRKIEEIGPSADERRKEAEHAS